ncbi:hypothetical protein FHS43_005205 [Streptosporangium becharense]|uniref:BP74 N-terminal domain-containing protein n=1 Tax=Streptosporangium becharense TaxID=1816182 RepID=A0A7W9MHS7_9ACTN|nr:calmodulin-binding protein [Streptosporangium becharense]MBB2913896.1 hypothetical protein [Streptosporangium becharense]MBB5821442.1 hypothetical protein [Streptosporangium becharense]
MRRVITKVGVLTAVAMLAFTQPADAGRTGTTHRATAEPEAYFEFDYPPAPDRVVFKLTDPDKIREARDILSGAQSDRSHVLGRIVKRPAPYNPGWSYHLDPGSISFFAFAIEVCDASPRYVEDHLDEAGGAFLPGSIWCPWRSRLLREVPAPQGPAS